MEGKTTYRGVEIGIDTGPIHGGSFHGVRCWVNGDDISFRHEEIIDWTDHVVYRLFGDDPVQKKTEKALAATHRRIDTQLDRRQSKRERREQESIQRAIEKFQ